MSETFQYLLRVRYGECDAQMVVFNARYVDYVDVALTEFQRALWGSYQNLLDRGLDTQLVNLNIDWQAPARFDDVLSVAVHVSRVGNTSFVMQADFSEHSSGRALASAEVTYVMVSTPDFRPSPIDDEARERLLRGAPGVVIDHAGVTAGQ